MERQKKNRNRCIKYGIISFFILILFYFGMSTFFQNHYYFGTVVNGVYAAGKTPEELDKEISTKISSYTLELEGRGNTKGKIKAADICLKLDGNGKSQSIKSTQNSSSWVTSVFKSKEQGMYEAVTYDENLLKECINKLSCLDSKSVTEPQNAALKYLGGEYQIVKEDIGNKINKDILYSSIVNAILRGETKLNLETANCYENPKYTSGSQKVIDTKNTLNKYISSKITYTYNGGQVILDGSVIHDWLIVDQNLTITFDEKKIRKYVNYVARNYNTYGKKRNFTTSEGTTIKVGGGNYGWLVNVKGEVNDLISEIKNGETISREPKYSQTAVSHTANDIGNTYVEINLAEQHLWFYKNGALVVEGDVVTGNVSKNHSTPTGIYRLKYKEKDATLDGEDYSVPVTYWMPFNGNIGIHDANWRKKFGGDIYLTSGSHGCVNAPRYVANAVYNNISAGTPIVCYYQTTNKTDKE